MFTNKSIRKRYHLRISGMVQGVFFRKHAQEIARQYGLVGWVRNSDNGEVEAVIEGAPAECEAFLLWTKSGSPKAEVAYVDVRVMNIDDERFSAFRIVE